MWILLFFSQCNGCAWNAGAGVYQLGVVEKKITLYALSKMFLLFKICAVKSLAIKSISVNFWSITA